MSVLANELDPAPQLTETRAKQNARKCWVCEVPGRGGKGTTHTARSRGMRVSLLPGGGIARVVMGKAGRYSWVVDPIAQSQECAISVVVVPVQNKTRGILQECEIAKRKRHSGSGKETDAAERGRKPGQGYRGQKSIKRRNRSTKRVLDWEVDQEPQGDGLTPRCCQQSINSARKANRGRDRGVDSAACQKATS
ncbi:hypothetical protein K438DRAFT_1769835 [Mycena galopus ATCC 62051]|nr:hypothetical protein K438DRAFT_1769835 [Mycena galopus ATCC 62051]